METSVDDVRRISAFTLTPEGGNPAGVWVGDHLPSQAWMQAVATEVGFSETVFAAPKTGTHRVVRYFSPVAEVPFCGHATVALGHVMADVMMADGVSAEVLRAQSFTLDTPAGPVTVAVSPPQGERPRVATLTSVEPRVRDAETDLVEQALAHLRWTSDDLDDRIAPAVAYAGASHLVLAARSRERLADLDYDFDGLKALMLAYELTTVALLWWESDKVFHARNPFPVGGVVEDPATGAAAAAVGGLLRARGLVSTPADLQIRQGEDMGRPSLLQVHVPVTGGIRVGGTAVDL